MRARKVLLILMIIATLFYLFIGIKAIRSIVGKELTEMKIAAANEYLQEYNTAEYIVRVGDTYDSIAFEFADSDYRQYSRALQGLNKIDPGKLQPGSVILVFKEVK